MDKKMILKSLILLISVSTLPNFASFTTSNVAKCSLQTQQDKHNKQLLKAAQNGNSEEVERLLKADADKEIRGENGNTPLHMATYHGHRVVVEMLLKAGADKVAHNEKRETPLHSAIQQGRGEGELIGEAESIVALLLEGDTYREQEDSSGNTPLSYALYSKLKKTESSVLPTIARMLLVVGNGELTFALKSHNLLQQWGFGQSMFKHSLETSKKLLEKHRYALCSFLQNQQMPKVLAMLISEYHESIDVRLLLFNEAECCNEHLLKAAQEGKSKEVKRLLQIGADKDAVDRYGLAPLHLAAENGHRAVVEILLRARADKDAVDRYGLTPLHLAAQNGHGVVVEILLKAGADKNAIIKDGVWAGLTPLHLAAQNGHGMVVEILLKAGADKAAIDRYGWAPLHLAARGGHRVVVEMLLKAGADKNAVSKGGWTPLHMAAWKGHGAVVKILLQAGADKNAVSENGWTPLHMAASNGQRTIVEILLRAGANRFAVDKDGKTSLQVAQRNVIDLLI